MKATADEIKRICYFWLVLLFLLFAVYSMLAQIQELCWQISAYAKGR